jgi:hypothetical protein
LIEDKEHVIHTDAIKTIAQLRRKTWIHLNSTVVGRRPINFKSK